MAKKVGPVAGTAYESWANRKLHSSLFHRRNPELPTEKNDRFGKRSVTCANLRFCEILKRYRKPILFAN